MSVVVVQHDWAEGLRNDEKVWAYHKVLGQVSTHGFLGDNNFSIVSKTGKTLLMKCAIAQKEILYMSPVTLYDGIHSKSVVSLDINNTGEYGVSVSVNNKVNVWQVDTGSVKGRLTGHVFDVTSVKFFPSGEGIISAGADMQIKVWDVRTFQCMFTLKGHIRAVTDMVVVEGDQNIISVGKDGAAILWSIPEAKLLAELLKLEAAISCCGVTEAKQKLDIPDVQRCDDQLELCIKGKILAVGCEDGKIVILDLYSRERLASHDLECAITCLKWLPSASLMVGLENGAVYILDSKKDINSQELKQFCHDSASAVLSMCPVRDGIIIGRQDGLCQYYSKDGINKVQFIGPDCDPVYSIAFHSPYIFTACRDHLIRKYSIRDMAL